jgi:ABC-type Fe3+ transport system permease subunit
VRRDCPPQYAAPFRWTAEIAAWSATAAVCLAAALVWFGRRGGWRRIPLLIAMGVGLAVPGPLIGLAAVAFFNATSCAAVAWVYERTVVAPTLVQVAKILPVPAMMLWFALGSIPRNILDAAALDGAGPWTQFWRIALPMRRRALVGAWVAAFALAVGELAASKVVLPPGIQTISAELFGLLHYGADDQVAAICLTLAAAIAIPSVLLAYIIGRSFWAGRRAA